MQPAVSYTPYDTYSRKKTGDIIAFTQFEEGNLLSETQNLLSETRDNTESGNKSDDISTLPPLISKEEMDAMSKGDDFDAEPMSTEMLEEIPAVYFVALILLELAP